MTVKFNLSLRNIKYVIVTELDENTRDLSS